MERKHLDLTIVDTPLGELKMYSSDICSTPTTCARLPNMYKKTSREFQLWPRPVRTSSETWI